MTAAFTPLAESLRPSSLDQVLGQPHLLGAGQPLSMALGSGKPHSMLFWGPPGSGKTTLARLVAKAGDQPLLELSAVLSGVAEIRTALAQARLQQSQGRQSLLFVDEIHRCDQRQQLALASGINSGLISLIGATTENPSFALKSALLGCLRVYLLKPLSAAALRQLLQRAQHSALQHLQFSADAIETMVADADGDARRLLNQLEVCRTAADASDTRLIDAAFINQTRPRSSRRFDKGGDQFYDQISALYKSVRGSNPDAALYWLGRMLDGGTDLRYLARKIISMAWDDIGLADPKAMRIASDAAETCERYGRPEAELALSQAVLYLAVTAKSNAGGMAYMQARAFVQQDAPRAVPAHLRAFTPEQPGQAYRSPHEQPDAYVAGERYLPEGMASPGWYRPVPRGLEIRIAEKLRRLKQLDQGCHGHSPAEADPGSV